MRLTKMLLPTLRENPKGSEDMVRSQILMYRAGMISQVSSGLFVYLPYFNKVLENIARIIREGMLSLDAQECKFPILVARDLLDASDRWDTFGSEMFKLRDRKGLDYALSPTNEEYACVTAKAYVRSYRDLPLTVFQIQQKHRDEIRPKCGVMRAREFFMKDAYSFHASDEDLDRTYRAFVDKYIEIFSKMGLKVVPVTADTGAMGGSGSQEIMALSQDGESQIALCGACGYAANMETVPCEDIYGDIAHEKGKYRKVHTPGIQTIKDLTDFFKITEGRFAKAVVFRTDRQDLLVAVVRGDRGVNDIKLRRAAGCESLELAQHDEIASIAHSVAGFVGPIGLPEEVSVFVDYEVKSMRDFIAGANQADHHYQQVNCADFGKAVFCDLRTASAGDKCPVCGHPLGRENANELGHCFKLGQRYTGKMGIGFVDADSQIKTMTMGCYGIGLERTVAAIIDQHHDKDGIKWPLAVAPYQVNVIPTDISKEAVMSAAEDLYAQLESLGVSALIDDREWKAGAKFKDSDLIGIPIKVIVGKHIIEGNVEIALRSGSRIIVPLAQAANTVLLMTRIDACPFGQNEADQ